MHGGTAQAMSARLARPRDARSEDRRPVNRNPNLTVVFNPLAVGVPDVTATTSATTSRGSKYFDAYGNNYYDTSGVYAFHRTEELYKAYPDEAVLSSRSGA